MLYIPKYIVPLLVLTLVLVSADIYSITLSMHYYNVANSISFYVSEILLSIHGDYVDIKVNIFIENPTSIDVRLEYVGVRPYVNNKPLIDPKLNPPFLGKNYFQGERSILSKFSNKSVTISFAVPIEVFPEGHIDGPWITRITIILCDVPLVDRMSIEEWCNAIARFSGG